MTAFDKMAQDIVDGILVTAFTYEHGPQKAIEAFATALREVHNSALEEVAKIIEAECARVLAQQSGKDDHFNSSVDLNLRMTTVLLPELAAKARALKLPDNGDGHG